MAGQNIITQNPFTIQVNSGKEQEKNRVGFFTTQNLLTIQLISGKETRILYYTNKYLSVADINKYTRKTDLFFSLY